MRQPSTLARMKNNKHTRRISFERNHKSDSLLIGNFGDVQFIATGVFDLSGMIYSKQNVEFTIIIGDGLIRFHSV
jgi:putative component of toxin-antitoxin plasmid stabilization module